VRPSSVVFFIREAFKGLRLHPTANVVSALCIALALVSLSFLVGGWWNLEHILEVARSEAEIVVYLSDEVSPEHAEAFSESLLSQPGVLSSRVVTAEESLDRVQSLLGPSPDIMEILEGYNPFAPSIEVGVQPESAAGVAAAVRANPAVATVRDNEEILGPLSSLTTSVRWMGVVASLSVGLVCLALVSHIVRLGISARSEEMHTLRLMGASEWFVSVPFIVEGAILGGVGALTALLCVALAGPGIYRLLGASLPFMPLVEWESLISLLAAIVLVLGLAAGTMGSLISLRSR
jgi:cell division transport system permease protein